MSVCCFTGHRTLSSAERRRLLSGLSAKIEELIHAGVTVFRNGGALGFDMMAALCVLGLKTKYPKITLCIDVPHRGQESNWEASQQELYWYILERADEVTYLSEQYYSGCMYARNRYMVDRSDYVLAYVRRTNGGSYYTATYAEEQGKKILYL